MSEPLVSVCLITYRQEEFVEEALTGILQQEQDGFRMEVVIGDDCSPDATGAIVQRYALQYPELIRLSERQQNLGMHRNWEQTMTDCRGDLIAIIEGDDRWDDPRKLAKQIALLQADPTAAACFSNAQVLQQDGTISPYPYVDTEARNLNAAHFFTLNANPIPTCTVLFRKKLFTGFPAAYYRSPFADWILHSLLIQQGDYLYLDACTASYRQHAGGVWSGVQKARQMQNKLQALRIIRTLVRSEFRPQVRKAIGDQLDELLYLYREQGDRVDYFKTWLKLKLN